MSDQSPAPNENPEGAQFALQRIYIKDASFESPRSPGCFADQWKPKVNLDLNTRHNQLDGDVFEVVLHVTITTRNEPMRSFTSPRCSKQVFFSSKVLKWRRCHKRWVAFVRVYCSLMSVKPLIPWY